MKGMGLVGAGVAGTAAAAPIFKDLDDLTSYDTNTKVNGGTMFPWWVKERPTHDPTVDVDWSVLDYKKGVGNMNPDFIALLWKGAAAQFYKDNEQARRKRWAEGAKTNKNGWTYKDIAFGSGLTTARSIARTVIPLEGWASEKDPLMSQTHGEYITPEVYGAPKYQGDPETNLRMIRSLLHFLGITRVGVVEIDNTTKKLFDNYVQFADVDYARQSDTSLPTLENSTPIQVKLFPNKVKYAIVWPIRQNATVAQLAQAQEEDGIFKGFPPITGKMGVYGGYMAEPVVACQLTHCLNWLGFEAVWDRRLGRDLSGMNVCTTAWGILGGNGELGRYGCATSPLFGNLFRRNCVIFTDLPLKPTPPIDAGIAKFCNTCKICADRCPSGSISTDSTPSYDVNVFQEKRGGKTWGNTTEVEGRNINHPGIKAYRTDWQGCMEYGGPHDCGICMAQCPFSNDNDAPIHTFVRATVGSTTALNGFYANMEKLFGYGNKNNSPEDWWNRNLVTWEKDFLYQKPSGKLF